MTKNRIPIKTKSLPAHAEYFYDSLLKGIGDNPKVQNTKLAKLLQRPKRWTSGVD